MTEIKEVNLSQIGKIITGKTPPTKNKKYFNGIYPFITPTDIKNYNVRLIDKTDRYLTKKWLEDSSKYSLPSKSICYVSIGSTVGKMCMTKELSFSNQQINSIVCNTNKVNPNYLFYKLKYDSPKLISIAKGKGSGKYIINKTEFENIKIKIPNLVMQGKIAAILSAYDELIENNNRRIEILEEIAESIYKEWFVNFRYPGHEKDKMVDSDLGKIPQGWKKKNLSDIVRTQYGYTETATEAKIGPKFLRGKDINKNSYIIWDSVPYCSEKNLDFNNYSLRPGDILVIRMADPGKIGIVEKDIRAIFASYLVRLKIIDRNIPPHFLFYSLLSDRYQGYINGASTGTSRKSASPKLMVSYDLLIPKKETIDFFNEQVILLRKLINLILEQNQKLVKSRDLLLSRLMSGKVDVSDLDIKTEEIK